MRRLILCGLLACVGCGSKETPAPPVAAKVERWETGSRAVAYSEDRLVPFAAPDGARFGDGEALAGVLPYVTPGTAVVVLDDPGASPDDPWVRVRIAEGELRDSVVGFRRSNLRPSK